MTTTRSLGVLRNGWQDDAATVAPNVPGLAELLDRQLDEAQRRGQLDEASLLSIVDAASQLAADSGAGDAVPALRGRLRRHVDQHLLTAVTTPRPSPAPRPSPRSWPSPAPPPALAGGTTAQRPAATGGDRVPGLPATAAAPAGPAGPATESFPFAALPVAIADVPAGTGLPWRAVGGHVTNVLIAAALSLVGIFCCLVVGLVVTGHHVEEVVTGSMQPTIPIGSLVVTESLPAGQLRAGDILVFPNPYDKKTTIVHRIVWLSHDQSGDVLVQTKGDYNATRDPWTLKRSSAAAADRVFYIIPGAGTVAVDLRGIGFWGLIALVVGVIGYYGVRKVRQILREDVAGDDAGSVSEST
jgi:signal peptidase